MQQVAFGDYSFDFALGLLSRDREPVVLGTRATALLAYLLRRRGEVVPKADLIGAAWGDQAVEDSNLSVQVAALRRVLGRDSGGRDWIATVERVGYRFLLPPPTLLARPAHRSVPIVEVELTGPDASLAEAQTDDLVAALSRFSWIAPRPRDGDRSAPGYRVTGRFGVTSGVPVLRIRLAEGESGRILWADTLETSPAPHGIAALHRVATAVEGRIHLAELQRAVSEGADSTHPYDLHLRARALLRLSTPEANARATALILDALAAQPDDPLLLGTASEAMVIRAQVGWPELTGHDLQLRTELARRAWAASEADAATLSIAGHTLFTCGEPELGFTLTELAAEMNPLCPAILACAGHSHFFLGEIEVARSYYQRAIDLAPTDPGARFAFGSLASIQNFTGEPQRARATVARGLAISPNVPYLHWQLMVADRLLDRPEAARRHFAHYRAVHPDTTLDRVRSGRSFADQRRGKLLIETLRELGLPES